MALSPDGKRLVRINPVSRELVDVDSGKLLGNLQSDNSSWYFQSPDVVMGMSRSGDWREAKKLIVRQYDAATGKELNSFEASDDDRVSLCAPVKAGQDLVIGVEKANRVKVWDTGSRKLVREFSLSPAKDESWYGFIASPNSKWIAVRRGSGPTEIFNGATGQAAATVPAMLYMYDSAFISDPDIYLALSNIARQDTTGDPLEIAAYDVNRQKVVAAFRGHEVAGLKTAVSANGKVMATGDEKGNVLLWDLGGLK